MAAHLGYGKSERGGGAGNARNGTAFKTVQTGVGPVPLQVPRDRRARALSHVRGLPGVCGIGNANITFERQSHASGSLLPRPPGQRLDRRHVKAQLRTATAHRHRARPGRQSRPARVRQAAGPRHLVAAGRAGSPRKPVTKAC
jgi:hypothetical protein